MWSCVVVWGGSWDRSAGRRPRKTSHIYDYRVVLVFDQSTISVKLPLPAYSVDEENAAVLAWALLEPIEGGRSELGEECRGDQGRGRVVERKSLMFATSISWDEVVV